MRYGRELESMIYFEVYGYRIRTSREGDILYDGLVLSSFRPVRVLALEALDSSLRVEERSKYVVLKPSPNPSVYPSSSNVVIYVHDRKELEKKRRGRDMPSPRGSG